MVAHFNSATSLVNEEGLSLKYRGVIQEIGPMVDEFLPHGILVFFGADAPVELREVSLVHDGAVLHANLAVGDQIRFLPLLTAEGVTHQPMHFRLTAIGEMVDQNIAQLGHFVIHFDAASTASLPGAISVEPSLAHLPGIGTIFEILSLENDSL